MCHAIQTHHEAELHYSTPQNANNCLEKVVQQERLRADSVEAPAALGFSRPVSRAVDKPEPTTMAPLKRLPPPARCTARPIAYPSCNAPAQARPQHHFRD